MATEDQSTEELFDSEGEGGSQPASTTTEETEDQAEQPESKGKSDSEEHKEALDLEETESTSSAEDNRQRQIDAWYKKITEGDKSLDDIPAKQKWLKAHIEERLEVENAKETVAQEYDVDAIVEEKLSLKLAQEKAKAAFNNMKEQLNSMDLTPEQKDTISQEFKDFRSDGLSLDKALDKARKVAGVKFGSPRKKVNPPHPSTVSDEPIGEDWRDQVPKDDVRKRVEHLEAERRKLGGF